MTPPRPHARLPNHLIALTWAVPLVAPCLRPSSFGALALVEPAVLWNGFIPGGGTISGPGFRDGNGVVLSQDGSSLWATDDEGSLHIWYTSSDEGKEGGGGRDSVDADVTFRPSEEWHKAIECRSAPSLFEPSDDDGGGGGGGGGGVEYAVYAVIDMPVGVNSTENLTR